VSKEPKTLVEVFTEEGLIDPPEPVVVCDCHQLVYCPTAWMNAGQRKDDPVES
jgi:hypothetical protein